MKTFCTLSELREFAFANLQLKLKGSQLTKSLFNKIVREEAKNKNVRLAIAKLVLLISYCNSKQQKDCTYETLAIRMGELSVEDAQFIREFLDKGSFEFLNSLHFDIVKAMLMVVWYKIGKANEVEMEVAREHYFFLKDLHLSHHLEHPVFRQHNRKKKAA